MSYHFSAIHLGDGIQKMICSSTSTTRRFSREQDPFRTFSRHGLLMLYANLAEENSRCQ